MINLQDLTDEQLNHLAAKAQDWYLDAGRWVSCNGDRFICEVFAYTPTTNGQQAMELLESFEIHIEPSAVDSVWYASTDFLKFNIFVEAPTAKRAIALAVVSSKFGTEIDEELLK